MGRIFFIFVFIIVSLNSLIAQESKDSGIFSPTSTCKSTNLGKKGEKREDTLNNAIEKILKKFEADNKDIDCLPDDLEDIMRQRLKSDKKTKIYCVEKKEKTIHVREKCKIRTIVIKERGGNKNYKTMYISPSILDKGVDKAAASLFHELIHSSENYYGKNLGGNDEVSTEDYSYTCTKQCFGDDAQECPGKPISECKECNEYELPKVPPKTKK